MTRTAFWRSLGIILFTISAPGEGATGQGSPVAVSPGSSTKVVTIDGPCPTFSWSLVAGAEAYELVVYRLGERAELQAVMLKSLVGSASSWTPSLDRCLKRGGRYAWSVRVLGATRVSAWSPPSFFEVAVEPSGVEIAELQDLSRNLGTTGEPAKLGPPGAKAVGESSQGLASSPSAPRVVGSEESSVGGGVVAPSFTGDGSALTALDPENLSAGTAAIDISGTAASASDLDCVGCVDGTQILDNSVSSADINDESISSFDIGPGAVGTSEILNGAVSAVDVNSAQIQLRVWDSCSPGSSIRVINSNGTVTCQPGGLSGWLRTSFDSDCLNNQICAIAVSCGGSRVLGGGLDLPTASFLDRADVSMNRSFPFSDSEWAVEATNRSGVTVTYRVWATCAPSSGATASVESATGSDDRGWLIEAQDSPGDLPR